MIFAITTQHKFNGEILTAVDQIPADGPIGPDVVVYGGVLNQQVACSLLIAKLRSAFIVASQPVTLSTNGVNAVQTQTIGGGVTGGTFPLTFGGNTVTGIPWNATAAAVQAALVSLASIGTGNVSVTGPNGGPWVITFTGSLAVGPRATITTSTASLTGGTPTNVIASTVAGVVPTQTFTFAAGIPLGWSSQAGFFANPFTSNITSFAVSNTGSVASTVNFRFGQNA